MSNDIPFFAGERAWAAERESWLPLIEQELATGMPLQGDAVARFEADLAAYTDREHAIAVGNATDALAFSVLAAGVGPGDEVLVPALSFIASASSVVRVGATPVFVDVDEYGLMDLNRASELVGERTRAVVIVQLFGQILDPGECERFSEKHGVTLIEDAAQSIGATAEERRSGSVGSFSCVSFDPTKTVSAPGSGGAVLTSDEQLAARVRRLRWHGRGSDGRHAELGFNSQLPSASAAVLSSKLRRDPEWTERRRAVAAAYDQALAGTSHTPVGVAPGREHVFHKYVVRTADRDALRERLAAENVPTLIHYASPLPAQPMFASPAGGPWPAAEAHCATALSLPIHAYLTDAEVEHICAALTP